MPNIEEDKPGPTLNCYFCNSKDVRHTVIDVGLYVNCCDP
jgi:hypothetical protein